MAKEKKLPYKEIPAAVWHVVRTLWQISPLYVLLTIFQELKDRFVPYGTLFITAAVTSKLPGLVNDSSQFKGIVLLVSLGVLIELVSKLLDILTQSFRTRTETVVTISLREEFYRKYAQLPYHLYEDKSVIDAFNYADEFMYRFGQFGVSQLARMGGGIIELFVAFLSLIIVAWFLPILLIVFLPLLIRSVLRLNREQKQIYDENRGEQRRVWAIENLFYPRQIKETRLYGIVDYFLAERKSLSQKIRRRELGIEERRSKMSFAQDAQLQAAGLFAAGIALWRIAYRSAPLGTFVLAQQLTVRAGSAVERLFTDFSTFDEDLYGFAEYRYITETLQEPATDKQKLTRATKPSLSIQDLSFTYPEGDHKVLKDLSLTIPYGSSLAIVGENGAGKTTLTRLILGLYQPQAGAVLVNDQPLETYDKASWLRQIGVLLQDFGMIQDVTIRESIWLGDITKPKDDELIWKALEQAELKKTIQALPHGLDSYLGKWIDEEKGAELSGGQLQRLAIARALFRDPAILIMDEPTSAVDANAEERIFDRLHTSRKGKTTIYISHRFSTVRRADHIVYMHSGKITEQGTHQELMKLAGGYHEMFTKQSKGYL